MKVWICKKCGNEERSSIHRCPICANRMIKTDFNSIEYLDNKYKFFDEYEKPEELTEDLDYKESIGGVPV